MSDGKQINVAVSWPELVEKYSVPVKYFIGKHEARARELAQKKPSAALASSFGGVAMTVAQSLVLLKLDESKPVIQNWLQLVPAALEAIGPELDENTVNAYYLLTFIHLAKSAGFSPSSATSKYSGRYITYLAHNKDALTMVQLQSLALMSLLSGNETLFGMFVDTKIPEACKAGEVFGFDYVEFIAYLAAAKHNKADWQSIEPAWVSFLASFPHKLAANTADWTILSLAGSIAADLNGSPIKNVAHYLHAKISGS